MQISKVLKFFWQASESAIWNSSDLIQVQILFLG